MLDLTPLRGRALAIIERAIARRVMIATAESCTGGLVAALLTSVPGSSAVVDRGFVTYSNDAKIEMLAVDPRLLARVGAVSREVASAMAMGALARSRADVTVAITGIAGPGGGSPEKPVGLVHFAAARRGDTPLTQEVRFGDLGRDEVRLAAVETALDLIDRLTTA
ncbi:MAG: CinA family protein [Hyphomicrobiales bacterium]|nr:CinA family protein [Hyphomicrobiales bacterium]